MRGGWRASVEGLGLCDGGRSRGVAGLRGRGGSLGEKRDPHLSPSPALRERGYRAVVEVGRVKGSRRGSSPGVRGWLVPLVMGRRNGGPCRLGGSIRRGISPMKHPLAAALAVAMAIAAPAYAQDRSEEHTFELQSLIRISYAVFCLKNKNTIQQLSK